MGAAAMAHKIKGSWVICRTHMREAFPGRHESQKVEEIFRMSWMTKVIVSRRVSGGESVVWNGHCETGGQYELTG